MDRTTRRLVTLLVSLTLLGTGPVSVAAAGSHAGAIDGGDRTLLPGDDDDDGLTESDDTTNDTTDGTLDDSTNDTTDGDLSDENTTDDTANDTADDTIDDTANDTTDRSLTGGNTTDGTVDDTTDDALGGENDTAGSATDGNTTTSDTTADLPGSDDGTIVDDTTDEVDDGTDTVEDGVNAIEDDTDADSREDDGDGTVADAVDEVTNETGGNAEDDVTGPGDGPAGIVEEVEATDDDEPVELPVDLVPESEVDANRVPNERGESAIDVDAVGGGFEGANVVGKSRTNGTPGANVSAAASDGNDDETGGNDDAAAGEDDDGTGAAGAIENREGSATDPLPGLERIPMRPPAGTVPVAGGAATVGGAVALGYAARRFAGAASASGGTGASVTVATLKDALRSRELPDWIRWLPGLLGYSRYDDSDPLDHENRAAIHDLLQASPGTYLSAIAEETGIPLPTVRYHLKILTHENEVESEVIRGKRRYFPAGFETGALVAALNDDSTAAVVRALESMGSATVSTLADRLDRDPSTVTHHLKRLEGDGIVERERDGRSVKNSLAPEIEQALPPDTETTAADASAPADD